MSPTQTVLVLLLFLLCNYSYANYYIICEIITFSLVQKLILNIAKLQAVLCMLKGGCVQTSARAFTRNSDSLHDMGGKGKRILLTPVFPECLKRALRASYIQLSALCFFLWKCRFSSCCILLFRMVAVFLRSLEVGYGMLEVSNLNVTFANIFENPLYHGYYTLHINVYCFKQVASFHCLLLRFCFS